MDFHRPANSFESQGQYLIANQPASADCLYDTTKQKAGLLFAKPGFDSILDKQVISSCG
jgi:hypothetical protein